VKHVARRSGREASGCGCAWVVVGPWGVDGAVFCGAVVRVDAHAHALAHDSDPAPRTPASPPAFVFASFRASAGSDTCRG